MVSYLDTSAILKLVFFEPGSEELRGSKEPNDLWVTSDLARTEVGRAVKHAGVVGAEETTLQVMRGLGVITITNEIFVAAGRMGPDVLRSLDAIHIAAACSLGSSLDRLITYDLRMADAARANGIVVVSPGDLPRN
ncbi:MAG: type II toxin-antitoxin system VapC family toxin [Propionibacteriaceae bacterium]|jgi:predicted nucleic acid-binding protein|nr:type II toxin-antitoxin system VapC family toxin [Propionibacteriaceae bacterium]